MLTALVCAALAAQTLPDPDLSTDLRDEIILQETLYTSVDPADVRRSEDVRGLVERQADEMVAATQRRVFRQERRIEDLTAAIRTGLAKTEEMAPAMEEMRKRVETARIAIERSSALRILIDAANAEEKRLALRGSGRGRAVMKYQGNGYFAPVDMRLISRAFARQFGRMIPVSASGDTEFHRALGFDHRGRVDVALSPDHPEGAWLCRFLQSMKIPYYAFRRAIPGSASAPHIHIGPGSVRRRS